MENMIGQNFPGLPQRSIYFFLATFPPFYPATARLAAPDAAPGAQEAAYKFIKNIYTRLYNDPSILGFKDAPDESIGDWELLKTKPGLAGKIRGYIIKTLEFAELLYKISLKGALRDDSIIITKLDMTIRQSQADQLSAFGIQAINKNDEYTFAFPKGVAKGLALLAEISQRAAPGSQKPYLLFSRGVFNPEAPWTASVFENIFACQSEAAGAAFGRLIRYLEANGYERRDNRSQEDRLAPVSLDYIKDYTGTNEPLKWAWGERTHGGIEVIYQENAKNQPQIALRVPYFAELLRHADKMAPAVKAFIIGRAKHCDNCRYCVQTDKTGKRPLKYVEVDGHPICAMFCGFSFRWYTLDGDTAENMIAMLSFIDEIFRSGGAGEAALKRWAK